jgi:hypothetical protein
MVNLEKNESGSGWNGYCQALGAGMSGMGTARLVEGYYPSILSAEL